MQKGDYEIKMVNFDDNTTIFLRDINCLNKLELILKKASSSKTNFSKSPVLWTGGYMNRTD